MGRHGRHRWLLIDSCHVVKPHGRSPLSVKLATDLALEEHESAIVRGRKAIHPCHRHLWQHECRRVPDSKRGRWREQTKGRFMFRRGVVGWGQDKLPVLATALPKSFIAPDEGCECVCHVARSALTGHYDTLFHRVFKIGWPSEIPLSLGCHVVKPHGRSPTPVTSGRGLGKLRFK